MPATSIAVNTGKLSPLSVGQVSRVQAGTGALQQIELIQFVQNPYALATPANALPLAAAQVTHPQIGTATLPDVQRITLNPLPYDGTFNFTYDGTTYTQIAYNASAATVQGLLGAGYIVTKPFTNVWQIKKIAPGAVVLATVDPSQLVVPIGVTGTLSLNQIGIFQAFLASQATTLTFWREIQIQFPGEDSITVFRDKQSVDRNVINLNTLLSATLIGLQTTYTALYGGVPFKYTNAITGLTGGAGKLDNEVTAGFALGYRIDFPLNGSLQSWQLVAGAADPADPTGQVAPLDYNAGSNNVHFQKIGGF